MRRVIASLLSFVLILSAPGARIALAQSTQASTDFEIPVLTITQQPSGLRGEPQNITVSVTDDTAVKSVQLFFRFSANDQFTGVAFERVADSDNYSYSIDTASNESDRIQYYMLAEDIAGNVVQRGYAFAPLSWSLSDSSPTTSATQTKASSGNKILYVVLGVLAAGALAGLASSSGGGGDGGGCDSTGCVLTLTSPSPSN